MCCHNVHTGLIRRVRGTFYIGPSVPNHRNVDKCCCLYYTGLLGRCFAPQGNVYRSSTCIMYQEATRCHVQYIEGDLFLGRGYSRKCQRRGRFKAASERGRYQILQEMSQHKTRESASLQVWWCIRIYRRHKLCLCNNSTCERCIHKMDHHCPWYVLCACLYVDGNWYVHCLLGWITVLEKKIKSFSCFSL